MKIIASSAAEEQKEEEEEEETKSGRKSVSSSKSSSGTTLNRHVLAEPLAFPAGSTEMRFKEIETAGFQTSIFEV